MKGFWIVLAAVVFLAAGCKKNNETAMSNIDKKCVEKTIKALSDKYANVEGIGDRLSRGVEQAAAFWTEANGTPAEFEAFCMENFVADPSERVRMAAQLEQNFESLWGCFNKMNLDLNMPLQLEGPDPTHLDELFGAYSPSAHFTDDMFQQKIAFIVVLNFPFYTLEEKNTLGQEWSRQEWAYARLGDVFIAHVPADVQQALSAQISASAGYIANYNIQMGHLLSDKGERLFPDLSLITHWGLRDELKTHYNGRSSESRQARLDGPVVTDEGEEGEDGEGLAKQRMIYQVMRRIIDQSIPQCVIDNPEYDWNPFANTVTRDGKEVNAEPEPDTRYHYFLGNFHAMQQLDRYNPRYPTAIARAFEKDMEVSFDEIEQLFDAFCTSPQVSEVARLIEQRLGRKLEPFDIWYDGFKSRSTLSEDDLSAQTRQLYPNREAFATKGMPSILNQLGFSQEKNSFICSHVTVDPSRGAGHAWQSEMRVDNAHLRTRIGEDGMDYKGYNIAVHEFGHNVEQTITLHDVDHYIMRGVPNTAFTEALAFVFQVRDLDFLGYKNDDVTREAMQTLDIFWGCYEIMGVALVDMYTWRWLYEHPDATAAQLKEQVIHIAHEVWNKYYAPHLGEKDAPILAIYSHMIDTPLYLANYPYGHIIHFQLEQQLKCESVAGAIQRIYPAGRLTPGHWMRHAVGSEVSPQPLLDATSKALQTMKEH